MTSSFPSGGGSSSTADPLAFLRPSLSGRGGPPPPSRRPVNSGGLNQPSGSHRYGSTFDSTPSFRRLPGNSVPGSSRRDQPMGSLATDFHVPPPTSKMILSHSYGFNTERPSFHQPSHREHDQFARGRPQLPEPSSSSSSFYRKPPSPRGREVRGTSLDSVMGGDFARRPPPSFPSNARDHDVGRPGGFRSFRDFPESRGRSRSPLRRSFKEDLMPLIPLPSRDALVRSFTSERRFRSRSPRRSPTPPPFRGSPDRVYGAPRLERDRNGDPMSRFFDSPPRRPLSPAPPLRAPPPRAIGRFDSNPPRYRRPSLDSVVGTRDRFRSPERSVLSREFRPSDSWLMSSPRRETRFPSPSPRASSRENRSRSKGRRRSPTRDRSFKDKKSEPVRATSRSHRHASKPPPKGPPTTTTPRKERKSPPRRPRFADPGGKSKTPSSQNASSHPKSRKESRSSSKSNASNAEQTREMSNDRDEKSRVSALKRLGPKLGVTERLGPKTAKKDDPKSKGGKDRAESGNNHDGPDKR
ncbi:hypothetical protein TCAL_10350 [Tigriopus californicus]|uniref:Uncharacterized protein n=2 Tax=Tigriopus californicus TaxID=6832 RepID=A0A553NCS1_TIGCA|nr:hypothetical protein TCAL_10350 [Tigriopus californicus]